MGGGREGGRVEGGRMDMSVIWLLRQLALIVFSLCSVCSLKSSNCRPCIHVFLWRLSSICRERERKRERKRRGRENSREKRDRDKLQHMAVVPPLPFAPAHSSGS